MGASTLRLVCPAGILRRSCFVRRMMSTTTTSPWLMLPPAASDDGGAAAYKFYSLASQKVITLNESAPPPAGLVKFVGSSHGWLASFNLHNNQILLSNPITDRHIKLPHIRTLPEFVMGTRRLTIVDIVNKIILTSAPAAVECRAVLTSGRRAVALCHPHDTEWTWFRNDWFHMEYKDFVYSSRHKRLFCATSCGAGESWDLTNPSSPRKDWDLKLETRHHLADWSKWSGSQRSRYLVFVEQSDQLFVVTRFARNIEAGRRVEPTDGNPYKIKTFSFDVHEIDWKGQERKVSYMEDGLNGLAMFVGNNHCFAVPAAEFPELKPDSIYFTDEQDFMPSRNLHGNHDIGIFNYADKSFSSVYYNASNMTLIYPPPMWFTPTYN